MAKRLISISATLSTSFEVDDTNLPDYFADAEPDEDGIYDDESLHDALLEYCQDENSLTGLLDNEGCSVDRVAIDISSKGKK